MTKPGNNQADTMEDIFRPRAEDAERQASEERKGKSGVKPPQTKATSASTNLECAGLTAFMLRE
jgi:hypothetical protein